VRPSATIPPLAKQNDSLKRAARSHEYSDSHCLAAVFSKLEPFGICRARDRVGYAAGLGSLLQEILCYPSEKSPRSTGTPLNPRIADLPRYGDCDTKRWSACGEAADQRLASFRRCGPFLDGVARGKNHYSIVTEAAIRWSRSIEPAEKAERPRIGAHEG
jgi:hypothetical protein